MVPTLREIKKERTRAAIVTAALELFAEHGYDAVPVAAIARAAEVGERTVYRYFVDKEEIVFADDDRMHAALADAVAATPAAATPLRLLHDGARAVAELVEGHRDLLRARAAVIAATPALQGREAAKHAGHQRVLVEELLRRGVPPTRARLVGALGITCFAEAAERWVERAGADPLGELVDGVVDEVRGLLASRPVADGPPGLQDR